MAKQPIPAVNIWVARIIPLILVGFIIYSAYVITKVVAIDYLIAPPAELPVRPRPGSAAAILTVYYLLLIPLLVSYGRLLHKIATHPGYVPRSPAWYQRRREEDVQKKRAGRGHHGKRRGQSQSGEKSSRAATSWATGAHDPEAGGSEHNGGLSSTAPVAQHLSNGNECGSEIPFWQRDIFFCKADGRPPFCCSCLTYKTDRTHHCSEVDRCVLKMDHFCPWVGGIISETSFKFFIQFLVYAVLFCLTVLTCVAFFISERRTNEGPGFLDLHFFLMMGISALFLLFSLGMVGSSIQLALINSSTVENLNRRSKVWFLAVLIPWNPDTSLPPVQRPHGIHGPQFQIITYPRPPEEEQFLIEQAKAFKKNSVNTSSTTTTTTTTTAPTGSAPPEAIQSSVQPQRAFAILSTKPGENPFDIGPWASICQVMGYSLSEWILPIKASPCADHSSRVSMFPLNAALVARLKEEAGLSSGDPKSESRSGPRPKSGSSDHSDKGGSSGRVRRKRKKRRSRTRG